MTYWGGDIMVDDILGGYIQESLYKNVTDKGGEIYSGDMPF